jgi:glutamine amidotransferase
MFMHNGGIGGWKYVKRRLAASLRDEWFIFVQGGTDSEWAFALFLDSLSKMGFNPSKPPSPGGFGHTVLRKAILETIKRINDFIKEIPEECREEDCRSLLNFAVTDGSSVVCTRYVSSRTDEAASLFWSSGTNWRETCEEGQSKKGDYKMERRDKGADIVLVASEPLTFERGKCCFPPHSALRLRAILTLLPQTTG